MFIHPEKFIRVVSEHRDDVKKKTLENLPFCTVQDSHSKLTESATSDFTGFTHALSNH
jgi:hypothetical protein